MKTTCLGLSMLVLFVFLAGGCGGKGGQTGPDASTSDGQIEQDGSVQPDGQGQPDGGNPDGGNPDGSCETYTPLPTERGSEPIVLSGSDLSALSGTSVTDVFLFRFDCNTGWSQIPHQVDERSMAELWSGAVCPSQCELRYVFSGIEGNGLDDDDEVVFMANDLGQQAWGDRPAGTQGAGFEMRVALPNSDVVGYAYAFASSSLSKDFGGPLVSYTRVQIDPDTEDTEILSSAYRIHFSRLWVQDAFQVLSGGGGDGVDLLDRWKGRAYDRSLSGETEDIIGMCGGWSNHAPAWGVHTYLGHIDGPVRAIRSIQGSCSWPNLTRVDLFYQARQDLILNIRGHGFAPGEGGIWGYWDYDPAAAPLTYYNPLVPSGTVIDGANDPSYPNGDGPADITEGWDQVDSSHGGIVFAFRETIYVPGPVRSCFWDDATANDGTGDFGGVIGGNGFHILYIGDTDPANGGSPGQVVFMLWPMPASVGNVGAVYAAAAASPLTVNLSAYP